MKTIHLACLALFISSVLAMGQTTLMDRLRRTIDRSKEGAQRTGRELYVKAKENLRHSKPEYLSRSNDRIIAAEAALQRVKVAKSGVTERKYFKARLAALEQHLGYARLELSALSATPTEEIFREQQRGFDFTLWSLEQALELSEAEAGF